MKVLSMLPAMSVGKAVRGSIFGQAVISLAASALLAAGGQLAGPPAAHVAHPATAAAKVPVREKVATQVRIEHCQSGGPQVWLTFDDGGSAGQVDRILSVLHREHVQAIFFPIGSWAEANPGIVASIAHAGQLIGDHTHGHIDLAKASDPRASWQIRHGLTHTAGSVPLLRPPFGAGAYTQRLDDIATSLGLHLCTWTVDTRDWTGSPAATIIRRVQHGDAITPPVRAGGVVIMHMNGEHTGHALPGVIHAVRARGLRLHALPG
jgi:peptidoglycan/xylan/chitin deacetylase (PgdA/CDA1 family)